MMVNILFVDDEPNILDGLQRMLRPMRHEWEMSFALGGSLALSLIREKKIDIVITDMKMPGMDGAELLQKISEEYPHIIRIILSGYSEREMIMRTVGTAHQYLSKPCEADVLIGTIKRVCALRNLLTDNNLRQLVSQLPTVPSLPLLYTELIDELAKTEPSTKKVGDVIKSDIGMTVKILQIVNSAFFGLRRTISDSTQAVEFLGLDTISSLTLGLGVISQFQPKMSADFFAQIWASSTSVGIMANKIANCENRLVAKDAFTAGLLHDIGKVVLAVNLPDKYKSIQDISESENISQIEAQKRVFGATHAEVGAYLLGLWGLPLPVVDGVAFHSKPNESNSDSFTAVTAVHAANAIQRVLVGDNASDEEPDVDVEYLGKLGLVDRIPIWQQICRFEPHPV